MNIFVIGATGFVGGALARHLSGRGHHVTGLARSDQAARVLTDRGLTALRGDLQERLEATVEAARAADAVVYAAQAAPELERSVVAALLDALADSGRTLLFLSGSGVLLERTAGSFSENSFAEDDAFVVEPLARLRKRVEDDVRAAASRGLRTLVVRPGLIWGPGDHGHVPMVYRSVAATGAACYVGDGLNVYGNVHVDDVARLVELVLEHGESGALYHAVSGEIPNRWIAERVATDLGVPVRSVDQAQAATIWGEFGAVVMGASSRVRAPRSRGLGWVPQHLDMLAQIGERRLRELAAPAD